MEKLVLLCVEFWTKCMVYAGMEWDFENLGILGSLYYANVIVL